MIAGSVFLEGTQDHAELSRRESKIPPIHGSEVRDFH